MLFNRLFQSENDLASKLHRLFPRFWKITTIDIQI